MFKFHQTNGNKLMFNRKKGGIDLKYIKYHFTIIFIVLFIFQAPLQNQAATKARKTKAVIRMERLEKRIKKYIKTSCPASPNGQPSSATWSVYVKNLKTRKSFAINDGIFFSASTIKLFAMAAAYEQAKQKKIKLTPALESQIKSMINVSSNDAFNSLVYNTLGADTINRFCKKYGYKKTQQYTPCGNGNSAIGYGKANMTSASDCGRLLEKIYRKRLVSKAASQKMLSYLQSQTIRTKIPQGIPKGITVANKTGENDYIENDTAIVFGQRTDYIICVFSTTNQPDKAKICIREISKMVYDHFHR